MALPKLSGTLLTALAAAGTLFAAISTLADEAHAQGRANVSSDVPALQGIWLRQGCMADGISCPWVVEELPLKARLLGFREAFDEVLAPKYDCVPATVPSLIVDPFAVRFEQLEDRVVLSYEKDDVVRTIWLEGHGHETPGVNEFFQQGYSSGRYEDGQLIVETTKFTFDPVGLDDMSNLPSSTSKRVVERYWRDGGRMMTRVTTEDPLFLGGPIEFEAEFAPADQEALLPWGCDPELARQPLQFLPPMYIDPGFVRIKVTPYGEEPR